MVDRGGDERQAVVANLKSGVGLLVRTPILRSTLFVFAPGPLLVRPVERPAAAVRDRHPRRHRVPVRAPGGPDLGRLRLRQPADGEVHRAAARGHLDGDQLRRVMGIVGVLYGLASNIWSRSCWSRSRASPSRRPRSPGRSLLQRNTPREFRGRVFSRVLRVARRAVPDRHGGRRPRRRHRHPAADRARRRSILIGAAVLTQLMPGPRPAGGRVAAGDPAAPDRARRAPAAATVRPATMLDFDKLAIRLPALGPARGIAARALRRQGDGPRGRHGHDDRQAGRRRRRRVLHPRRLGRRRDARARTAPTARCRRWARATSSARSPR